MDGLSKFTRILSNQQRGAGHLLYGLIFGLTLTGLSFAADPPGAEPLAEVNGETITAKDLEGTLDARLTKLEVNFPIRFSPQTASKAPRYNWLALKYLEDVRFVGDLEKPMFAGENTAGRSRWRSKGCRLNTKFFSPWRPCQEWSRENCGCLRGVTEKSSEEQHA